MACVMFAPGPLRGNWTGAGIVSQELLGLTATLIIHGYHPPSSTVTKHNSYKLNPLWVVLDWKLLHQIDTVSDKSQILLTSGVSVP